MGLFSGGPLFAGLSSSAFPSEGVVFSYLAQNERRTVPVSEMAFKVPVFSAYDLEVILYGSVYRVEGVAGGDGV